MGQGCDDAQALRPLLDRADVIAIGPGLGTDAWARSLFAAVLESDKALVLDADALNLLAAEPVTLANAVLTPHPGDAARLLGCTTAAIHRDRLAALQARSEERRVGKEVSVRVDLGGRRILKKKKQQQIHRTQ